MTLSVQINFLDESCARVLGIMLRHLLIYPKLKSVVSLAHEYFVSGVHLQ